MKNNIWVRKFLKAQFIIIVFDSAIVLSLIIIFLSRELLVENYSETHVTLTEFDGSARRGIFVIWVLLFLILNAVVMISAIIKSLKGPTNLSSDRIET